jgi:subtilisin family serine protease
MSPVPSVGSWVASTKQLGSGLVRRAIVIAVAAAALVSVATSAAAFEPVRREGPRVRAGALPLLPASAGRVTVIVGMPQPPLALFGRTLASAAAARKLDVRSTASRAYVARLARTQAAAVAQLRRAIPEARVGRRYRIVLDGFEVTLPARRLPALARLPFASSVYPSVRYTEATNRSPEMIGATELQQLTGADGAGMKIAIVDTGVDRTSPFLAPDGLRYPTGFPKGDRGETTPKVIVARTFPGPGSGRKGRLAFDATEPHGTHVAGIAAGDAGTRAPAGPDHPAVSGLSGVAPRAYIGNYRVFTVPTPLGHVANTPEIVAAFEAAVADGMDVVNFSGGGAETDPANDALIEAVRNLAAAGVVPVVAAGNDRDDYGLGTVGSPGTAPEAISVAAVSNTHDFAPAATVTTPGAPADLQRIPVMRGAGGDLPTAWARSDQAVVDVASIPGAGPYLCGPPRDPNGNGRPLPARSLAGAIAVVSRGICSFASKVVRARAAGAIGVLFVDNRPGEANAVPEQEALPTATISDLDGGRLRAFAATTGGRTQMRFPVAVQEVVTGRGGTITSFSSAGPTVFGHRLKPDVSAPGGQILSSTPPRATGSTFSVFDGTSMAAPHVAGAAALLLELHRGWTPRQVKSALVSTATPAWADTAQTKEASVLLGGGGIIDLPAASDPRLFTDPSSLSFADLDVRAGARREATLLTVSDAGGGAGTWQVELHAQTATAGASLELPPSLDVGPGGVVSLGVAATATADATPGENYGFVVLRQGDVARRVPYAFLVTRPQLALAEPLPLRKRQDGDTRRGVSRASVYCCPSAPFGLATDYTGRPMDESGAERVYVTHVNRPVANAGVSVESASPGSQIDPWWLGSLDENDVQGYPATPVNVNDLLPDVGANVHAAGVVFPRQQEFFVSVDSGTDRFTGRPRPGSYVLRSWVDDVTPPAVELLTRRVPAGRPLLVARVTDGQSGVETSSLVLGYRGVQIGAEAYDAETGVALFPLPPGAPPVTGRARATLSASDVQETKNVATFGPSVMPNTRRRRFELTAAQGPVATWLAPPPAKGGACVRGGTRLLAAAGSTAAVRSVRFLDGRRRIAVSRIRPGLYSARWKPAGKGRHVLRAVVRDARGRTATAERVVRVGCRP